MDKPVEWLEKIVVGSRNNLGRWIWIALSLIGLVLIFVFQRIDCLALLIGKESSAQMPNISFVLNRTVRLVLNDTFCVVIIANYFPRPEYLRLGWMIFLVELFILLPAYLAIKLSVEGPTEISSPLLQPVHRMIVNPLLMIMLMSALYYQEWKTGRR